jgi:ribosome biogenesis GTPase A
VLQAVEIINRAMRMPGSQMMTQQFKKAFENTVYHMVIVGNTNVGKSTLLNDLMGSYLLNTNERRETTFHWHIRYPLSESLINEDPNMFTL